MPSSTMAAVPFTITSSDDANMLGPLRHLLHTWVNQHSFVHNQTWTLSPKIVE